MKAFPEYKNKTVLVTGGAAGIGRGLCEVLAKQGAIVYAADINEEGLQKLVDSASAGIIPVKLDVSQAQDFQYAIDKVLADHGRLDILFNNAGIAVAGAFKDMPEDAMERIININLWSVIHGTRLAYAQMLKQGYGHIVNISSSAGMMPVPNQSMYSAIKHAVIGLSHSLREEAALHGVKVSAVLPGLVQSDLWDNAVNIKDYNLKKNMESTGLKPISPYVAAEAILQGVSANDRSIIFPRSNKIIVRLYQLFPGLMTKLAVKPLAKPAN
jgi:NAD(P)-dependent dehydrogenase (short-subunit alcohol dehydrogenase family)